MATAKPATRRTDAGGKAITIFAAPTGRSLPDSSNSSDSDFGSLIPVRAGNIGGVDCLVVDARQLHASLGAPRLFRKWMKERIAIYGFVADQDYQELDQPKWADRHCKTQAHGGDRRSADYTLNVRTAKELAMVERGPKGKLIRHYFIECEKQLERQSGKPQAPQKSAAKENAEKSLFCVDDVNAMIESASKMRCVSSMDGYREFAKTIGLLGPAGEDVAFTMAAAAESKKYRELLAFLTEKNVDVTKPDSVAQGIRDFSRPLKVSAAS